tara:strand:- start:13321 stop:14373 length:1053 start_codon:yes stop_codon:yes gene_type:complete
MINLKSRVNKLNFINTNFSSEHNESNTSSRTVLSSSEKIKSINHKKVAIILGYYDGHKFIKDQLLSIFKQTHKALHVFLCDDKSKKPFDLDSLKLNSEQISKLSFAFHSKNVGFVKNFIHPLSDIPGEFEYYAFSDQDDIWHSNKLEKAISKLEKISSDVPALYFARTEIVDANAENTLHNSTLFCKPLSFTNALVQSIGGGNTMVFNSAAKNLIKNSFLDIDVISHDWWIYQIISGVGGYIFYDPEPCLKYRQHDLNLIGANNSFHACLKRMRKLSQGHFRKWCDMNLKNLSENKHLLTISNQRVLDDFIKARQSTFFKRLYFFKRSGIYRQTLLGNLGLIIAVIFNKV